MNQESITVDISVNAPVEKVWACYTTPTHITQWNSASPDWHTPRAENDVRAGGKFMSRMEAKDGSAGFDFSGTYTEVVPLKTIAYTMDGEDSRKAIVSFFDENGSTRVSTTFEIEHENPVEMQREGWQTILNNLKAHVEAE